MTFTMPEVQFASSKIDAAVLAQYINDQSLPVKVQMGKKDNVEIIAFRISYATVAEGFLGKIVFGEARIWEGTTVHDTADDAIKEGKKLLMTRMAKLFE